MKIFSLVVIAILAISAVGSVSATKGEVTLSEYYMAYAGYYSLTFYNANGDEIPATHHSGYFYAGDYKQFSFPDGDINSRAVKYDMYLEAVWGNPNGYTFRNVPILEQYPHPYFQFRGAICTARANYDVNGNQGSVWLAF
jgi:hypothetical protein